MFPKRDICIENFHNERAPSSVKKHTHKKISPLGRKPEKTLNLRCKFRFFLAFGQRVVKINMKRDLVFNCFFCHSKWFQSSKRPKIELFVYSLQCSLNIYLSLYLPRCQKGVLELQIRPFLTNFRIYCFFKSGTSIFRWNTDIYCSCQERHKERSKLKQLLDFPQQIKVPCWKPRNVAVQ